MRRVATAALLLSAVTFGVLAQEADLSVVKTAPAQAAAGSDVAFAVSLTNNGPDAAADVTLQDPIPPGMTFVSATQHNGPAFNCPLPAPGDPGTVTCTNASIAAGTTIDFTFVFRIADEAAPGTFFVNQATASTTTTDPNSENNTGVATTSTPFPPQADLRVTKTGPDRAGPGRDIVYTIELVNGGPEAASNVALSDTLPGTMTFLSLTLSGAPLNCTTPPIGAGGTITCTAATFPAAAATTLTLTGHVAADTPSGTEFTNFATVSSDADPNDGNDTGVTSFVVSDVDLAVTKSGPATTLAGQDVPYTLTLTNNGPDAAVGVTLFDPLPPGTTFVSIMQTSGPAATCVSPAPGMTGTVTCSIAVLGPGGSPTFTLMINAGDATSIANTASATSESFDRDSSNDSSTVTTTVTPVADLAVTKTGPASADTGSDVTYALTVSNIGPSTAANVSLTDVLPPGLTFVSALQTSGPAFTCSAVAGTVTCTIASLDSGAVASFSIVATIPAGATGTITNVASVTAATADPAALNNTSAANTTITSSADLGVTKSGPAAATGGSDVTYIVTLSNIGPSTAANVSLTDVLPPGVTFVSATQTSGPAFTCSAVAGTVTCTIASLVSGAVATFSIVATIPADATGTLTNVASVTAATADPAALNNTAAANTTVTSSADLGITKTGPAAATGGSDVTYNVTVSNAGPSTAVNVSLSDAVPAGATFVSATQNSGPAFTCVTPTVGTTGTIICTTASLAPTAAASFTFVFAIPPAATGTLSNTATVTSATPDPMPGDGTATVMTSLTAQAVDLSITKTAAVTTAPPASDVTFTIVASNAGPVEATGVTVTDVMPAGTTLVSATPTQGTCTGTTTVVCSLGNLATNASATVTLILTLPATPGPTSNTATVSATTPDSNPANDTATATVTGHSAAIPALSIPALAALAALLALAGSLVLRVR